MKIIRINEIYFKNIKESIRKLIEETLIYNFPDSVVEDSYYVEKLSGLERYLRDGSAIVYIAVEDEKILGWIWCHPIQRFDKLRLHIASFAVVPFSRKTGIGHLLIENAEKYAVDNGFDGLDLLVTKDNTSAVSFYKKNGYEVERYLLHKELSTN